MPSDWPLPPDSIRFVLPRFLVDELARDPLSQTLYPVSMGFYKEAKGHHMRRNRHTDNLLIYCTQGKASLATDKGVVTIKSGDLVVLPEQTAHHYQTDDDDPWTIYWAHFLGSHSELFLKNLGLGLNQYHLPLGLHHKLIDSFATLLDVRQTGYNRLSFLHAANLLRQILSYIALLAPQARQPRGSQLDLEIIHSMMQEKIHTQLDLDTLAAQVNLSKYHFATKYKELTGCSPIQRFIHMKIERACYLLDITDKSIGEISYSLGYDDAYYFSRIFKKVMGQSPTRYRRVKRN